MDSLAARGTRFNRAFANTQGTVPSHTTMLTSTYQEAHRMFHFRTEAEKRWQQVPAGTAMVQEILGDRCYRTLAVTDGGHMSRVFGFSRGFEVYVDGAGGAEAGTRRLAELVRGVLPSGRPVFAFLHTYEVHSPYDPPEPERTLFGPWPGRYPADSGTLLQFADTALTALAPEDLIFFKGQYDGGIRYTDRILKRFFAELEEMGFLHNAVVVLTADHGEEFGEHGGLLHRGMLYEESIRVPLILKGVGVPAGKVDGGLVSLVDIAPTLLALAGAPAGPRMRGRDLLRPPPAGPEAVFTQYGPLRYGVRTREWKLIVNADRERTELYNLRSDPAERINLAEQRPDVVRDLIRMIKEWRKDQSTLLSEPGLFVELSEEVKERLKSLGYLTGQ
jgi:arylsulfatase A-like enzyme